MARRKRVDVPLSESEIVIAISALEYTCSHFAGMLELRGASALATKLRRYLAKV